MVAVGPTLGWQADVRVSVTAQKMGCSAAKTASKCPTGSFDGMPTRQMILCTLLRNLLDADACEPAGTDEFGLGQRQVLLPSCSPPLRLPPSPGYTSLSLYPTQDRYSQSIRDR
jgi:hypothetical protein